MSSANEVQEHLEHAAHGHEMTGEAKRAAIVIAIMAAVLALTEFAGKDAQNGFLANHIAASDVWTQYQAKAVRRTLYEQTAAVLDSLPDAGPELRKRTDAARAAADRMRSEPGADGMEQLGDRAHALEHARDHELHRTHGLETASGGLQIAIVLASISVVTGARLLMTGGIVLALAAAGFALLASLSLV